MSERGEGGTHSVPDKRPRGVQLPNDRRKLIVVAAVVVQLWRRNRIGEDVDGERKRVTVSTQPVGTERGNMIADGKTSRTVP